MHVFTAQLLFLSWAFFLIAARGINLSSEIFNGPKVIDRSASRESVSFRLVDTSVSYVFGLDDGNLWAWGMWGRSGEVGTGIRMSGLQPAGARGTKGKATQNNNLFFCWCININVSVLGVFFSRIRLNQVAGSRKMVCADTHDYIHTYIFT
jgi:hypothetical protein